MVGIAIRAPGLPRLEAVIRALEFRGEHTFDLFDAIGLYLESSTDQRFETETGPDGRRWDPSIRAEFEGGKTLTDSARLRQSIAHVATRDRVEIGTNVIYAGVHQKGATIAGRGGPLTFRLPGGLGFVSPFEVTIPARPFLGIDADDEDEIIAIAEDFFAGAVA